MTKQDLILIDVNGLTEDQKNNLLYPLIRKTNAKYTWVGELK